MIKLQVECLEGKLVKITTEDNHQFIDYYELDFNNQMIQLESYNITIGSSKIVHIEEVKDFGHIYDGAINSNYISMVKH